MQRYFQEFINPKTKLKEILVPAKILSIGSVCLRTKNGKEYRTCKTEVEFINGTKNVFRSNISEEVLKWFNIQLNDEVTLRVQLEGAFANYSWVEIPYERFDSLSQLKCNMILWVGDLFRTNRLSHEPGGNQLILEFNDGQILGYDKIKFVHMYFDKILESQIDSFDKIDSDERHRLVRVYLDNIYLYHEDMRLPNIMFKKIWNNIDCQYSPWDLLTYAEL